MHEDVQDNNVVLLILSLPELNNFWNIKFWKNTKKRPQQGQKTPEDIMFIITPQELRTNQISRHKYFSG